MTLPWGSQPPVGGSALIFLTDTPPHPRKIHIEVREKKREREIKKKGGGGWCASGERALPLFCLGSVVEPGLLPKAHAY